MSRASRHLQEVAVAPASLAELIELLDAEPAEQLLSTAQRALDLLAGRVVWNINSTASGGGVAEMLQSLVAYGRGAGVDTRWLVLEGDPEFFVVTKRLHNLLHGARGDGGELGVSEHSHYTELLAAHHTDLLSRVRAGDIAVLHDPQTAGLVDVLRAADVHVVWRCHIGSDAVTPRTDCAWGFLRPYVQAADAFVFSRAAYVPDWVPAERRLVIAPSIDPLSVKNRAVTPAVVGHVLGLVGLAANEAAMDPLPFIGRDGSRHVVQRRTNLIVGGQATPPSEAQLVVQVSRWDTLKDMTGVMTAFVEGVADECPRAHLVLAGPAAEGVGDDPEGARALEECTASWQELPAHLRRRVHLVRIPMNDLNENAMIVNALQRRATLVVQKSLAEGFGLTVTEAMWKARPVVASAVGGIPDQMVSGEQGVLVDPHDLRACGRAITELLLDPVLAANLGAAAMDRVKLEYLGDRHLRQYVSCFADLLA